MKTIICQDCGQETASLIACEICGSANLSQSAPPKTHHETFEVDGQQIRYQLEIVKIKKEQGL